MDTGYFSIAREISWPTTENCVAYGYLYMPANKDFNATGTTFSLTYLYCGSYLRAFNMCIHGVIQTYNCSPLQVLPPCNIS